MVRMNHKIYHQVTLDINDSDSFYWFLMGPINQASPCVSTHSERLIENKHEYWIVRIDKSKKGQKIFLKFSSRDPFPRPTIWWLNISEIFLRWVAAKRHISLPHGDHRPRNLVTFSLSANPSLLNHPIPFQFPPLAQFLHKEPSKRGYWWRWQFSDQLAILFLSKTM